MYPLGPAHISINIPESHKVAHDYEAETGAPAAGDWTSDDPEDSTSAAAHATHPAGRQPAGYRKQEATDRGAMAGKRKVSKAKYSRIPAMEEQAAEAVVHVTEGDTDARHGGQLRWR